MTTTTHVHHHRGRFLLPAVSALAIAFGIACQDRGGRGPAQAGVSDTAAYQAAIETQDAAARTASFEDFLAHYPKSIFRPPVYRRLYDLKAAAGDLAGAESFLRTSLKKERDSEARSALYYALCGHVLSHQPKELHGTLERMLADKGPLSYELLNAVSWDLADAGQELDMALELADRAVAAAPDSIARATTLDTRGWVRLKRNEHASAVDDFQAARKLIPEPVPEIEDHLAQALAASGDRIGARQVYVDLLVDHEIPELRARVAGLSQEMGESPAKAFAEVDQRRVARSVEAPDFTLADYQGRKVRLKSLRGQVVLLNFWHPTCGPCRAEFPHLQAFQHELKGRGFTVVGVEVTRRPELAQQFLKELGVTFPVVEDKTDVAGGYQVTGTPTNFLIDREGRIIFRGVGYAPGSEGELRAQIEYLLTRKPAPTS
jgi:peroxiredoxin